MANFQVAYNPTTLAARVQMAGAAIPGGSINVGTFTHVPGVNDLGGDVQRVYFHHVRDLLYKRTPAGAPGFFPNNITDMHRITLEADTNVPPLEPDEPEEP